MFQRILVAVDGSPASNAGLKSAIELAADQHATLLLLHVIDDSALAPGFEGGFAVPSYIDMFYDALRDTGRKVLAKAGAAAKVAKVESKLVLAEARAATVAHVIVRQARKLKADIIVIGTHGRRGLRRVLMGSDAEAVVREAGVPVLLVRGGIARKRNPAVDAALLTRSVRPPTKPARAARAN
jgi:nucleotide-binding universal stress UspA family protein